MTYDGAFISQISLWLDKTIYYSSTLSSTIGRVLDLRKINSAGGSSSPMNYGMARSISISDYGTVLGKNTADPARWKRYKGGTAGEILIDKTNKNIFKKLFYIKGNIANPFWIDNKIFFISDHEGIGNIYSCNRYGKNITKHTHHKNYFARNATTDGTNIVYHAGADIYLLDVKKNLFNKINIDFASSKIQASRKFTSANKYLESTSLSNSKNYISMISRGKPFVMGNWNGPALQYGEKNGIRYKHSLFLNNDKKIFLVSDKDNKETIEFHTLSSKVTKKSNIDFGRILSVKKSPKDDSFTIINHKHELFLYNATKDKSIKVDRSKYDFIDCNWSPDGKYIAYIYHV